MLFDWVLLVAGVVGSAYVVFNARRLASRPRRGTAWNPSYRAWLLGAAALLLIAVGALIDLVGS
jgi:cytochrome c oxidase assembly factor CtaG